MKRRITIFISLARNWYMYFLRNPRRSSSFFVCLRGFFVSPDLDRGTAILRLTANAPFNIPRSTFSVQRNKLRVPRFDVTILAHMRPPKDITLGAMARKLSALTFTTALDPVYSAKEHTDKLLASYRLNRLKGVTLLLSGGLPVAFVRQYIGGEYRTVAGLGRDWLAAARLADMLAFRFGARRLQTFRELTPADFNNSREQAEKDWQNEPTIAAVIMEIEKHFDSIGALFKPGTGGRRETQLDRIEKKLDELLSARFQPNKI